MPMPTQPRPPRRPLAGWTLIPPVLLAFGLLWARTQEQPTPRFAAQNITSSPRTTLVPEATSAPRSAATPTTTVAPDATIAPTPQATNAPIESKYSKFPRPIVYVLFVPGDDGMLHRKESADKTRLITRRDYDAERMTQLRNEAATRAVKMLMKAAPEYFPANIKLLRPLDTAGGTPYLDFNRAFEEAPTWNRDADAQLALAALVNTAIETRNATITGTDEDTLQLRVEGKPVRTLGELDASGPIDPDMRLVAPS